MKIKFNEEEKKVISGFLFQTKYGARRKVADMDYLLEKGSITNDRYEQIIESNKQTIKRIEKLINKFVTPSAFIKLKRNDAKDLTEIVDTVVVIQESVVDADKPHLTDADYQTCKSALEKLIDGLVRSVAQDR